MNQKDKTVYTKKCRHCGKEFVPKRKNNIYCSQECKTKACHKSYYENNKEKCKASSKAYKKVHFVSSKIVESKICPICGKEFTTSIHNKLYCSNRCKGKAYRISHKEHEKERSRVYYTNNMQRVKEWEEKNKERRSIQKKEYYLAHKEEKREYARLHKEQIRKNKRLLHYKNMKENPTYRMIRICRGFVRRCLENKKLNRTQNILGYTPETLRKHIEKFFYKGMSWDNYSEWEIHHIEPLDTFNFLNEDGTDNYTTIREANALSNLVPLFIEDHKKVTSLYNSDKRVLSLKEIQELIGKG